MSEQPKETEPTKKAFDFVELITGRVGKIAALVTAVGGLALVILNQSEQVRDKLIALGWYTPPPCLQIERLSMPDTVQYSEWDNMEIKLKGRNTCPTSLGLYVTFVHRQNHQRFVLGVPYEDRPECKGPTRLEEPECWDWKIPLDKGDWEWRVQAPPLTALSDPRRIEKISIKWAVYNYKAPAKSLLRADTATVEIHNDAASTSSLHGDGQGTKEAGVRRAHHSTPAAFWKAGTAQHRLLQRVAFADRK